MCPSGSDGWNLLNKGDHFGRPCLVRDAGCSGYECEVEESQDANAGLWNNCQLGNGSSRLV